MSNNNEVQELHMLIEKSDNKPEEKKTLHEDLKSANGDQAVIDEIKTHVTPRQHAEHITDEKEEEHHLGDYTPAALQAEIVALGNTKPMFRSDKWNERAQMIKRVIQKDMKKDPKQYQGLLNKIDSVIQGEL